MVTADYRWPGARKIGSREGWELLVDQMGKARTKGAAPFEKGGRTAGHSHRLTSGGIAVMNMGRLTTNN